MKLEDVVTLKDGRSWKAIDVQTVIQYPNEIHIWTLESNIGQIRLTEKEMELNQNERS